MLPLPNLKTPFKENNTEGIVESVPNSALNQVVLYRCHPTDIPELRLVAEEKDNEPLVKHVEEMLREHGWKENGGDWNLEDFWDVSAADIDDNVNPSLLYLDNDAMRLNLSLGIDVRKEQGKYVLDSYAAISSDYWVPLAEVTDETITKISRHYKTMITAAYQTLKELTKEDERQQIYED